MVLVKTGQFVATMPVTNLPMQFVPATGTAIQNPSPFILTNSGRDNGDLSDIIIVNDIAVEPTDANEVTTVSGIGSVAMYVCTVGSIVDGTQLGKCVITPLDSADGPTTGLVAYSGPAGNITARTIVGSLNMAPSYFNPAGATVAHMYGPMGNYRSSASFPTSEVDPQGIDSGQAFQVRRPDIGNTDSVLSVTVQVRTTAGKTYIIEGTSGFGPDILTIFNNTGSLIYVTDVSIVDWYRVVVPLQRYEVVISTSSIQLNNDAHITPLDSSKPLPSWVESGSGMFFRQGTDMWLDYQETLDVHLALVAPIRPTDAAARANRPFVSGRPTSKYLRPGKSLVFTVPTATVMYQGSHDIRVAFSTYTDIVSTEYSYAY